MQIALDTAECCNAASRCCHPLTISSPMGNQMWPVCHVCLFRPWWTADKWTRIADADTESLPAVLALRSLLKGHLEIGVETKLLLVSVFVERRGYTCLPPAQLKRCPQPLGKYYNEDLYAYTLPHFNCKRCAHPALWTSDGCIMGRAQNVTVHHVRTMCRFTFHCRLLQSTALKNVWIVLMRSASAMKQPANVAHTQ